MVLASVASGTDVTVSLLSAIQRSPYVDSARIIIAEVLFVITWMVSAVRFKRNDLLVLIRADLAIVSRRTLLDRRETISQLDFSVHNLTTTLSVTAYVIE